MAYPFDGTPNLRPGAERIRLSVAPLYDPALSLDELWEDFLAGSASLIGAETETDYCVAWGLFCAWLDRDERPGADGGPAAPPPAPARGGRPRPPKAPLPHVLGIVDKQCFIDYIAYLQRRPKLKGKGTLSSYSVNTYMRPLRTFVRWLAVEGYYPDDPLAGGKRGIMPRKGPRMLRMARPGDCDLLLDGTEAGRPRGALGRALRDRDRAIVLLGDDTGVRTGDVCHLTIGDVDLRDGWILIRQSWFGDRPGAPKWDRERRVPISREVCAALRLYLRRARPVLAARRAADANPDEPLMLSATGRPLTGDALYQALGRAYRRGGGAGRFGLHRFRHRWGTTAAEKGVHPAVSQAIMGHADIASQAPYLHPSDETLKREHARITPLRDLSAKRRRRLA